MQYPCKHLIGFSDKFFFFITSPKNFSTFQTQLKIRKSQKPHTLNQINSASYTNLLQSSTKIGSLIQGKLIHSHMIKRSFEPCIFLENNLLNMYCKCGGIYFARQVFDRMPKRDVISWNLLISGYSQMGCFDQAMQVFLKSRTAEIEVDKFTYSSALSVCARTGDLKTGMLIHGLIIVSGLGLQVFLINSLIDMYSKCSRIDLARCLFDNSNELDDVSWNLLITGYVRTGLGEETLRIFVKMHRFGLKMNSFALGSVLKLCSNLTGMKEFGELIHGHVIKVGLDLDVFVGTAMLDMYAKVGKLDDAIKVFNHLPDRNVVSFNAMIAGFFRSEIEPSDEFANEALRLFSEMQTRGMKPTKFTFSSILRACNLIDAFEYGKQIHAQIFKNNLQTDEFIGSALIDMYLKSGSIENGLRIFNSLPKLDVVLWTSMISGCVRNGRFEWALQWFYELLAAGGKPDQFTISSVFGACANLATMRSGEQVQGYAVKTGLDNCAVVTNSQICMYAKAGDIDSANQIFSETENRDVVSWSVMISSHAQHGCAKDALRVFEEMKGYRVSPNHITLLGVLTACSHGGLVDEGLRYFESMKKDYSIDPNVKHNACVVDLLGRAGKLSDAEKFIENSGFEDDPIIWRALLGACQTHRNTDIATRAAKRIIDLEPHVSSSYVLLYNIYSDSGKQLLATQIRDLIKERGIKKEPGLSWIEIGTDVHSFVAGDRSHPMSNIIYAKLEEMLEKIKGLGYVNDPSFAFKNFEQEHKENLVNYHSEKLAVVLGIISLPGSAPIRVIKNLRVCGDCHTTMKLFSKIERREIVLRDPIRFHRFREGSCSCRDYW